MGLQSVDALINDPKSPLSKVESAGGDRRLQYMAADFASTQACVVCHNAHSDSPKQDFQLGAMMGALVVTVPLNDELSAARRDAIYIALGNIGVLALLAWALPAALRIKFFGQIPVGYDQRTPVYSKQFQD